jgi:hypothetical protein
MGSEKKWVWMGPLAAALQPNSPLPPLPPSHIPPTPLPHSPPNTHTPAPTVGRVQDVVQRLDAVGALDLGQDLGGGGWTRGWMIERVGERQSAGLQSESARRSERLVVPTPHIGWGRPP